MKPTTAVIACCVIVSIHGSAVAGDSVPAWPQFRGPGGSAVAPDGKKLPLHFGPKQNVLWKIAVPSGWSSPCIWGDRIFLTAYEEQDKRLVTLCIDRHNGRVLWRRVAPAKRIERVYKVNSPASSTPATDGKRVYVYFGSYGLLCYDIDGKIVWQRPLPTPRTRFGSGTSPIVTGDTVLLNSQGDDLHVMAFDASTGRTKWTTQGTPFPSDYPVPMLWQVGSVTEVIVPGRRGLLAYDLRDGSRRWWITGLSPEVASSPARGDGLLFVASHMPGGDPEMRFTLPDFDKLLARADKDKDGKLDRSEVPRDVVIFRRGGKQGIGEIHLHQMYWLFDADKDRHISKSEYTAILRTPFNNSLLAIRPGGKGEISQSHIAWRIRRGVPEVPSPLYYRGRVYLIRNGGILTCVEAKSGKHVFRPVRLGPGGIYYASPVAGDGKIYLISDSGVVTVIRAADRYEVLAENDLEDTVRATPALLDGKIYLRTANHLYAFGKAP